MNKTIIILTILVASVTLAACTTEKPTTAIMTFDECASAGGDITESYPRQCTLNSNTYTESVDEVELSPEEATCNENNGNWIPGAQECEGMTQETCESLGGDFNACASACRNDPEATVCTMQCVLVCEFGSEEEPVIPTNCTSWFDGCNTCMVENGTLGGCTRMACAPEALGEPTCVAYAE